MRWIPLAAVAVVAGLAGQQLGHWGGVAQGRALERAEAAKDHARLQNSLTQFALELGAQAAALERARLEQESRAKELEDAARQDPDGLRPGIGAAGVQRLRARWSRD